MANWIIGTDKFNETLDRWLAWNEQKDADWLSRNKEKIPPNFRSHTGKLYRGMTVNADFLQKVEKGKLTFDTHTSWSKDMNMAKKFATDERYMVGKAKEDSVKILISKVISTSKQIIDIHGYVLFMGTYQLEMVGFDELSLDSAMKEEEVLVQKGIKITKSDIKFI